MEREEWEENLVWESECSSPALLNLLYAYESPVVLLKDGLYSVGLSQGQSFYISHKLQADADAARP